MITILAEKPSQARNFAKALGGVNGIYHGESYTIVAARGHLYEYVPPDEQVPATFRNQYSNWQVSNLPWDETLFAWKRAKKKGTASTIRAIVDAAKRSSEFVVATDNDPTGEGQLLAFEIIFENAIRVPVFSRMYFDDESPASIQRAFVNRKRIPDLNSDPDYRKAQYRSQWDYLSMQFTRIATACGDGRSVLRQGRLKSAMVLLVGDQLNAVANYQKTPSYANAFTDEYCNLFTSPDEPSHATRAEVPQQYHSSRVVVDSVTAKKRAPSRLIDLAGLSAQLASRGIKAKTVLQTYQNMYEAQVVSYPRTEDKSITPEQFNELLPHVDRIARLVGVDPALLTHRTPRDTHVKTGMAHGANRPGLRVPNTLDDLNRYGTGAQAIYTILAKSYLAMLAEDYEYDQYQGHVADYPAFTSTVNVARSQGWHQVSSDDTDSETAAHAFGDTATPFVRETFPPKPQAPSMRWLMKQLEQHDVGTGATRTSIYAEVTNENSAYPLLIEKRGKLTMSKYGLMSHKLLPGTHIGDLALTETLMKTMRDISRGNTDPAACLAQVQQLVIDDIATMQRNGGVMRKELHVTMGDHQFEKKEKYQGVWNGQPVSFTRSWGGHRFTDQECEALCNGESIEIHGLKSKAGKEYGITGQLSQQSYNGHSFIGFERTGFANKKGVPDSWCKHTFSAEEKTQLESGCTIHLEGVVSKKGNTFDCDVRYGEREDGTVGIIPLFD